VATASRPLRVLITVDTEFWPQDPGFASRLRREDLNPDRDFRRDTLGEVAGGSFGVPHQLDVLERHGLRAVYFVEALAASVVGMDPLRRTVDMVREAGQSVELHLHTEWLLAEPNEILPGRTWQHIHQFTYEEQRTLLALGRDNLVEAGSAPPTAYRAGNFGASWETVRAVAAVGLRYDSSLNAVWVGQSCAMPSDRPIVQPERREGAWEIPVSCFEDWPGHLRPAQVTACSSGEMIHAMRAARAAGWRTFVIVFHSHEMLNARRNGPNPIVIRRFHRLCRFLDEHRDDYPTTTFADLTPADLEGSPVASEPIRSAIWRTAWRWGEQLAQRFAS
jgi:hypothetical protein